MEGLNIELIAQLATFAVSTLIAIFLFFPKLRSNQAATAASSATAAAGAANAMGVLVGEHKQLIANLRLDLTTAQTQIAVVERNSAQKDVEHDKQVNRLDTRIEALENQVREEKKKREEAERELRNNKEELEKTKERVRILEEWVKEQGFNPDEIVKKKSANS